MLKSGWALASIAWRLRWIAWRYVRVYYAEFKRLEVATLKLEFGPVSERELPLLSEGDCHVSTD